MYIAGMLILTFFALIGLCAFITAIADLIHSGTDNGAMLILSGLSEADAEARVRRAARICRDKRCGRLICVVDPDDPAKIICENLTPEYPFIEIMDTESAIKLLRG